MKRTFDVLFLGGLFPKETEKEIIENSIGLVQNAANALQWNLVTGLDANLEYPVHIINALYIGSYPRRYKKLFIKGYSFSHISEAKDINVGFCNLSGLKVFSRERCIRPYLKKWALDGGTQKVVVAYAMTSVFVQALAYVKGLNSTIKTCLIVPDLPQYMDTGTAMRPIYSCLKSYDSNRLFRNMPNVDSYVLLTKQMSDFLQVKKYVVVEGTASDIFKKMGCVTKLEKTIAYTGSLNKRYGVLDLVTAFQQIKDPDCRLVLCGAGDAEKQIKVAQSVDPRIQYRGLLTREEAIKLQREATVLVNPRKNTEEFAKYSFPSKNLEYLSSGTPMIAYRLDGIPSDYDAITYYVDDNTVESLKNTLIMVLSKSPEELHSFGTQAQEFVLREKSNVKQAEKILEMIEALS